MACNSINNHFLLLIKGIFLQACWHVSEGVLGLENGLDMLWGADLLLFLTPQTYRGERVVSSLSEGLVLKAHFSVSISYTAVTHVLQFALCTYSGGI